MTITATHPHQRKAKNERRNGVNGQLTANRSKRLVENDTYGAFARRIVAAYGRRVADGDVDALAAMTSLAADLDDAISQAVAGLRQVGYSWAEIGARLDISRQAAQQRWGNTR